MVFKTKLNQKFFEQEFIEAKIFSSCRVLWHTIFEQSAIFFTNLYKPLAVVQISLNIWALSKNSPGWSHRRQDFAHFASIIGCKIGFLQWIAKAKLLANLINHNILKYNFYIIYLNIILFYFYLNKNIICKYKKYNKNIILYNFWNVKFLISNIIDEYLLIIMKKILQKRFLNKTIIFSFYINDKSFNLNKIADSLKYKYK